MIKLVTEGDYTHLAGVIPGPPDTPYEGIYDGIGAGKGCISSCSCLWSYFKGGTFHLDVVIPDRYPFNPPKVGRCALLIIYEGQFMYGEFSSLGNRRGLLIQPMLPTHAR